MLNHRALYFSRSYCFSVELSLIFNSLKNLLWPVRNVLGEFKLLSSVLFSCFLSMLFCKIHESTADTVAAIISWKHCMFNWYQFVIHGPKLSDLGGEIVSSNSPWLGVSSNMLKEIDPGL